MTKYHNGRIEIAIEQPINRGEAGNHARITINKLAELPDDETFIQQQALEISRVLADYLIDYCARTRQ